MAQLLEYDFRVVNSDAVAKALASTERRIAAFNARSQRVGGTAVQRSGGLAESRAAERYWKQAAQKSADYRIAQEERAHRQRMRQIDSETKAQERAVASLDRQRSAALSRQFNASERAAKQLARSEQSERRRVATGILGRAGRSVAGTLSAVGSYAGAALGIVGTVAAGSAIRTQIDETARASQLANQAGRPEIKGELLREAQGVKGFTGMEALEGLGGFVDITGDLESARKLMPDMSKIALATSTNLTELGAAMGSAFIPLADQIKDPTERLKALNNVMRATAGMGAVGAVEVKDLAGSMAGLAAASGRFAGPADKNLDLMVAMAQASRQRGGSASAEEAVTSVQRFTSDIVSPAGQKRLKGLGVDVFADKAHTQLKGPEDIILDVLKKTGGNLTQLTDIFGERGVRAVQGFSPLYAQAERENAALAPSQRKKAGAAGEEAVRAEFDRLLKASVSTGQIDERAKARLSDPDMQLKEATKAFNARIGSELLPVLTQLIPEFTKLIPDVAAAAKAFAEFARWAASNPFGALGAIIAAKLVADLAMAGIGEAVKGAVLRLIGGGAAGGVPIPGGSPVPVPAGGGFLGKPTMAGVLGAVGIGTVVGGAAAEGIYASGVSRFEQGEQSMKESGNALNFVRALGGQSSGADFRNASDMISAQEERVRQLKKGDTFDDIMGFFGASNKGVELSSQQGMLDEMRASYKAATEAAQKQNEAANKMAEAANKLAMNGPPRGNTPSPPVP